MKMKYRLKNFLFTIMIGIAAGSMSSCDYLQVDRYIYDMTSLDSVFSRKTLLLEYLIGASAFLPDESRIWTNSYAPYGYGTDECFTSWRDNRHCGMLLLEGEITPFTEYYNNYVGWYKGIRSASLLLQRMDECPDLTEMERRDIAGRAHFLRGYYYYKLIEQYGPVPILPEEVFDANSTIEEMSVERSSYDDCIDFICQDMEKAYEFLYENRPSVDEKYQPTKGAALAVISRIRLYQASPLFNGNAFYSDWLRSDGTPFISQQKDNSKWGKAAVAAKRVINMNKYSLNIVSRTEETRPLPANVPDADFPNGAGNVDAYLSYASIFNGDVAPEENDELIYYCYGIKQDKESPAWIAFPVVLRGGNGLNITQNLVDAYRMEDGTDIHESPNYPSPSEAKKKIGGTGISFSGTTICSGDAAKMYANREMRFYATIAFNYSFWEASAVTSSSEKKNIVITYYKDGTAGNSADYPEDCNRSGYTCKKYIHPEDHLRGNIRDKAFPIFRYAEILLNYAEALNELDGSYTDEATGITVSRDAGEILGAFNQIRYRAGLPGLTTLPDQQTMRDIIKRERQIEFACEARRYHDLRRWKDAMEVCNEPWIGLDCNAKVRDNNGEAIYNQIALTGSALSNTAKLATKEFTTKMYFMPIPRSVLDLNNKLVQNPGW